MTEWSVSIDTQGPDSDPEVEEDRVEDLVTHLEPFGAVAWGELQRLGARLNVVVEDMEEMTAPVRQAIAQAREGPDSVVGPAVQKMGEELIEPAAPAKRAIEEAVRQFTDALEKVRLPRWPVVNVSAETIDELERELARPVFPELVGVTEVAELLEVSKQRVSQLVQSHPKFPPTLFELAATPVWSRWQVERFKEQWTRRPGRPPKDSSQ